MPCAPQDYEAAANFISTFLELEAVLSGSMQTVDVGQAEEQRQVKGGQGRGSGG